MLVVALGGFWSFLVVFVAAVAVVAVLAVDIAFNSTDVGVA